MFEKATHEAFRYPSAKGLLTTEQLWDLPLQSKTGFDLDSVARVISREIKALGEESFVDDTGNKDSQCLKDCLAVVVHIINVKKTENAAAAAAATKRAERARLVELLHVRKEQDLMSKSPAEIQAMIDALG
jgi:hypothetical protein